MSETETHHHADHRAKLNRVRRLEGQVRGVGKMIERGDYCVDIVTQLRAVARAAKTLEVLVLEDHVSHCFEHALHTGGKESEQKVQELLALFKATLR